MQPNSIMTPRKDITVRHTRDQFLIGCQRIVDLELVAQSLGRDHLWSREQSVAEGDNIDTDKLLSGGNHPIRDEWQLMAEYGAGMLRIGAHAA